jgi:DNA-binding response OmpR family regulator
MNTIPTVESPDTTRPRVLLVEDNEAAGRGLARLLEVQGYHVTIRHDGASALRALESGPAFDFLLTDLRLPDLDGREVARHARGLVPAPRIALITGWDIDGDPPDHESWGIDWVFIKPLDTPALLARLRESRGPGGR